MRRKTPKMLPCPLIITDRHKEPTRVWRGAFSGAAFLVCGGPSFTPAQAAAVSRRGVFSLAVNNVAGQAGYRPTAFVCSDPPSKFHHGIWLDPTVMKFIPIIKFSGAKGRNTLREKVGKEFKPLTRGGAAVTTLEAPNVWGFERRSWFKPDDTFFSEPGAAWGNNDDGVRRTGEPKTVCTLLLALRLLYHLGFRRIFLLGVDFRMVAGAAPAANYSFGELRDTAAVESNNAQFRVVNAWLCKMASAGVFAARGLEIFNCNPISGLRAFAHVPFDTALAAVTAGFPAEPFDLENWYLK